MLQLLHAGCVSWDGIASHPRRGGSTYAPVASCHRNWTYAPLVVGVRPALSLESITTLIIDVRVATVKSRP